MDLPNLALSLAKALCRRADEVRTNVNDCKQLTEFVKRTVPLLEHLSVHSSSDACINLGLEAVVEALELAKEAVNECCESSSLRNVFYAKKIGDDLRNAASRLSYALSLLSATNVGISGVMLEEILSLKEQLKTFRFGQAADTCDEPRDLRHLVEVGFSKVEESVVEIKELLESHFKMLERLQAEFEQFKRLVYSIEERGGTFFFDKSTTVDEFRPTGTMRLSTLKEESKMIIRESNDGLVNVLLLLALKKHFGIPRIEF